MSLFDYEHVEKPGQFYSVGRISVMFIDIVGVTKSSDNQGMRTAVRDLQNSLIDILAKVKWDTEGTNNGAVLMPTGDGYAIGFEPTLVFDEQILKYAADISQEMKKKSFPLRIGISNGPCFTHLDLNARLNLCGWGIVEAERTMSVGGRNYILCEKSFAKSVLDDQGENHLHYIGKSKGKHGRELEIYNYYSSKFGNRKKPLIK